MTASATPENYTTLTDVTILQAEGVSHNMRGRRAFNQLGRTFLYRSRGKGRSGSMRIRATFTSPHATYGPVPSFVRKWRARQDETGHSYVIVFAI